MKKGKITGWGIAIAVILILVLWGIGVNNRLVSQEERVNTAWGNVETQYQRRSDLIPRLVSTVQGAADFEKSTLEAVVSARASATQTKIDASNLTEENIAQFQKAQDALSSALSKMLVTIERYPELKANQNFLDLQAQLEGTENRIAVARRDFNESVRVYNPMVRRFPNNVVAGMCGFKTKAYFKAAEGAENAPDVNFNFGNKNGEKQE
ncbi:MAG: LemA family protein [Bacteroidales bacterium]|jgi:LemA protein|nr:LemA family protein [Bacteroidales bacterium]MCI2122185.1 LemA family protein [Bacteroidales bacterium]MCI2145595.1 LemA family protein [Bacteroidales bacterium]